MLLGIFTDFTRIKIPYIYIYLVDYATSYVLASFSFINSKSCREITEKIIRGYSLKGE